jgi:hypothetical protein
MILNKSEYVGGRGKKQRNTILIGSYVETKSVIIKESNFSFHYCCGIPKISQVREKFLYFIFFFWFVNDALVQLGFIDIYKYTRLTYSK